MFRPAAGQDQQDQRADQGGTELQGGQCGRVPQVARWSYCSLKQIQILSVLRSQSCPEPNFFVGSGSIPIGAF